MAQTETLPVLPAAGPRAVEWATVPRVNLLPPEILEGRRFRKLRIAYAAAVLLTLVAGGGLTVWAQNGVDDAQADLDAVQLQVSQLQARQAQYAEVPRVIAEVEAATAARALAMADDVAWYRYLGDLQATLPSGVELTSTAVTMTGSTAAAAAAATATGTAATSGATSIGSIAFAGTAPNYSSVSSWLDAVDKIAGIDLPALSSASRDGDANSGEVTFSNGVTVTDAALSHLYDQKDG